MKGIDTGNKITLRNSLKHKKTTAKNVFYIIPFPLFHFSSHIADRILIVLVSLFLQKIHYTLPADMYTLFSSLVITDCEKAFLLRRIRRAKKNLCRLDWLDYNFTWCCTTEDGKKMSALWFWYWCWWWCWDGWIKNLIFILCCYSSVHLYLS